MNASAAADWRLPVQWPASLAPQERAALQATRCIQGAIVFAILALTVLDRFGVRVMPGYSIPPGMIALYVLLGVAVLTQTGMLNTRGAAAYLAVACIAGLSYLANATLRAPPAPSLASFLLLLVLYLPFAFTFRPGAVGPDLWRWMVRLYIGFALFLAAAGIAQFFLQFVFRPDWLFNYMPLIPEPLRASGGWNTVNWAEDWIKSNGFFLREASIFSVAMAFALVCELSMGRRKWVLAMLAAGLVLTYSGSGLLCLAIALLFPLDRHCLPRVLALVTLAAAVYFLFGDALNLGYTVERVGELNSGKTSAYCRFVLPNVLILQNLDSSAWASLLGNGPGSMPKLDAACANGVETTYAKAVFEYGLLGALAFGALIFGALNRSAAPVRIRIALAVMWLLLGGNLLTSEFLLLIFLFSAMWPAGSAANHLESNP
jgi:hypothetical protein